MAEYALRFEVSNFSGTIYDVQDISSIRGSSFAALKAPKTLLKYLQLHNHIEHAELKFEGGSQGIYRIVTATSAIETIENDIHSWWTKEGIEVDRSSFPLKYLQFTVATLPWQDELAKQGALIKRSGALCKWKQFDQPAFIIPQRNGGKVDEDRAPYCDIDHTRPACHEWVYRDPGRGKPKTLYLSDYIYNRRNFGASLRPKMIYAEILGNHHPSLTKIQDDYFFTDSFEQIVAQPKEGFEPLLPVSLENKMAVVYFDVNGLGKLRRKINTLSGLQTLSDQLHEQRRKILASILDALCDDESRERWLHHGVDRKNQPRDMVRFETLLWGADEFSWVMPSWLAWDFLDAFFQHAPVNLSVNEEGQCCGHSGGMVICNRNMPIRKVRHLVGQLRERAKEGVGDKTSTLQVEILESIDIPDGYLDRQRQNLFGIHQHEQQLFTLQGESWPALTEQIALLKATLPRSQLRTLLQSVATVNSDKGDLQAAEGHLQQGLRTLLDSSSYLKPDDQELLSLEDFQSPLWGTVALDSSSEGSYLMALYHLDRLWDYVQPFGDRAQEGSDT